MKNYLKETIILLIQLFIFYTLPLFCGPTDAMGMVVLILLSTLITGLIVGIISKSKIKYGYPIVIALLFIPSVFIYYNESSLIHSIWYLVSSYIGLGIGLLIRNLKRKINICKENKHDNY